MKGYLKLLRGMFKSFTNEWNPRWKKSKASSHSYAMQPDKSELWKFKIAKLTYEELFRLSPHYPAWVRYYYVYSLFALQKLDDAEKFIIENQNLKYSYYGTNEIFHLCLVYIAHKRSNWTC